MYDRNSNATELTPLTGGLYRNKYTASLLTTNYNNDRYYMRLIKHIWSQISKYVWKLVLFLLILVIINTIFRSLFKQETSLIFTSDHGNNNNNNNLNSNYALSNDEIEPNLIWIVTDLELTQDSPYLNTLINQGLLLQNYHISYSPATYSMNRISSLTSKYVDKLTDDDINDNYFDKFISQKYEIHKSNDIDIDMDGFNSFPFLIYMMLDGQVSINHFENKIEGIISDLKLKENNQIWQNSLLIINSDTTPFSLLYGPRIPNKKRGTKSQILFQAVDWEPTLLHFSHNTQSDDEALDNDGFDLWETLFYNEISARKDIPTQKDIQITEDKIYSIQI